MEGGVYEKSTKGTPGTYGCVGKRAGEPLPYSMLDRNRS